MSVKGLNSLLKKLEKLGINSQEKLKKAVGQAAKYVQGEAKERCPVNNGPLRNSIYTTVKEDSKGVTGVVGTNMEYAPYVEFGTGPKGRASAKEMPSEAAGDIQYKAGMWWIHESQIDPSVAEKYHFIKRQTGNGTFYGTYGQPAQPFLYPALKNNDEKVKAIIRDALKEEIRKVVK